MRVLLVDHDSAMLETIVRSLRERYIVDAVTNKGDCLDLLRQNTFEAIIACERLEDGSGLELLGQVQKRWPTMLRLFSAERHRLQLLKGRLSPFQLFQTLPYPIDPERLISALGRAEGEPDEREKTSEIEQLTPGGETELQEEDAFPPPRPAPRVAPQPQPPVRRPAPIAPRSPSRSGHSGRIPAPALAVIAAASRAEVSSRPAPVRFPQINLTPITPSAAYAESAESIEEVAAIAREAQYDLDAAPDDIQSRNTGMMIGAAAAVLFGIAFLGIRVFGSHHAPGAIAKAPPSEAVQAAPSPGSSATPDSRPPAVAASIAPAGPITPPVPSSRAIAHSKPTPKSSSPSSVRAAKGKAPAIGSDAMAPVAPATAVPPGPTVTAGAPVTAVLPPETPVGLTRSPAETLPPTNGAAPTAQPQESQAAAAQHQQVDSSSTVSSPQPAVTSPPASATAPTTKVAMPSDEPPPVIREPRLIRRVEADYPSAARRDGMVGSVELAVTVSTEGKVTTVSVSHSNPPGVFDKSAIAAVRRYRYDPKFVDGLPAEAHLTVHLDFKPDTASH